MTGEVFEIFAQTHAKDITADPPPGWPIEGSSIKMREYLIETYIPNMFDPMPSEDAGRLADAILAHLVNPS
jgi:hypothetical protein